MRGPQASAIPMSQTRVICLVGMTVTVPSNCLRRQEAQQLAQMKLTASAASIPPAIWQGRRISRLLKWLEHNV